MNKRPMTQREANDAKKGSGGIITLYNRTRTQPVYIQLRAPRGVDFYLGEQTVVLHCGKTGKFPVNRLYKEQIVNHQKAGRLTIVSGNLDQ